MTLYVEITVETLLTIKLSNTSMDLTALMLLVQQKHLKLNTFRGKKKTKKKNNT